MDDISVNSRSLDATSLKQ